MKATILEDSVDLSRILPAITLTLKILCAIFLVYALFVAMISRQHLLSMPKDLGGESVIDKMDLFSKSFNDYQDVFSQRDFFKLPYVDVADGSQPALNLLQSRKPVENTNSRYKLVGILLNSTRPQAVIEDTSDSTVNIVSPGEKFHEMRVQEISEGKVVVESNGVLMEMKL